MKKFLLVSLVVMVLLSVVSFAYPEVAGVSDRADESGVAIAGLAEETDNGGINLDEHVTNYAPSIRTSGKMGVRFKAGIATEAKYETENFVIEEYGFVIARKDHLDVAGADLTLDFPKAATGVAYNKAENKDVVFDATNDDICIFTGVLVGIPVEHYATDLVCKIYAKVLIGGETYVCYGEAVEGNVYELAKQVLESDPENEECAKIVADYEEITEKNQYFANLVIPTTLSMGGKPGDKAPYSEKDSETGETVWYVFALVDDIVEYIPVNIDSRSPKIIDENGNLAPEYEDKICTYTVDEDGIYTIMSTGYDSESAVSKDILSLDSKTDTEAMYYVDGLSGKFEHIAGSRFELSEFERFLTFTEHSKIIIREYDEEKDLFEYVIYDGSYFEYFCKEDMLLENISLVLFNRIDTVTEENIGVIYAEENVAQDSLYRIISGYDIGEDSDGKWRFYYSVYDPFTGTRIEDVPSVKSADKVKDLGNALTCGTVVKITNDLLIDDAESEVLGNVDFSNLVWIKSMDEASMTVVPVDETAECKNCVEKYMEAYTGTNYKDFLGNEHQSNVVEITEDTVFTVMKRSSLDQNFFVDATISPVTLSAVLKNGKNVLCYNSMSEDRNYNYITTYADYKKALVLPDSNGEAVFVIIIVNDRDAAAYNVACSDCQ